MLTKLLRSVGSSYKGQWRKKWIVDSVSIITAVTYGTKYSRVDQVKFVEDSLQKIWRDMVLNRPYPFNVFQGCLSQILLGPLLNTLSHIGLSTSWKLCLNLCSRRWLSPYRTRAIYLIKIGLWQSKKRIKRRPYEF